MTSFLRTSVIVFEIAACQAAVASNRPDALLARLGESATRFWDQFSAMTCTETVDQKKLEPGGKMIVERKSTFDYLIILQLTGDELMVEESRILQGKAPKESDRPLLATNGFSTLLLVFHPLFQQSYEFEDAGESDWNGARYRQLRFRHISGRRSPSVVQLHKRDYPIEWQGTAWIDPGSGSVARIQVELKAPMTDVGLLRLASEVQYAPVPLKGSDSGVWMPQSAVVEAATQRQRWVNTHRFSGYRRFQVNTQMKTEAPREK